MLLHTLLVHGTDTGAQYPFWGKDMTELQRNVTAAPLQLPAGLSAPCCDLLSRLLRKSAAQRMTIEEVRAHPWLVGHVRGHKTDGPTAGTRPTAAEAKRAPPPVSADHPSGGPDPAVACAPGPMAGLSEEKLRMLTRDHRARQQLLQPRQTSDAAQPVVPLSRLADLPAADLLAAAQAAQAEMFRPRRDGGLPAGAAIRPASARGSSASAASAARTRGGAHGVQAPQHKSRLAGLMTASGGSGSMSARSTRR